MHQNKSADGWSNNGTDLQYTSEREAQAKRRLPAFKTDKGSQSHRAERAIHTDAMYSVVPARQFYETHSSTQNDKPRSKPEKAALLPKLPVPIDIEDDDDEIQEAASWDKTHADKATTRTAPRPRASNKSKAQPNTRYEKPARAGSDVSEDSLSMPSSKPPARLINNMASRRDAEGPKTAAKAVKVTNRADVSVITPVPGASRKKKDNWLRLPLVSLQLGPTLLRDGTTLSISPDGRDFEICVSGQREGFLRFNSGDIAEITLPKPPLLNHYKLVLADNLSDLRALWLTERSGEG